MGKRETKNTKIRFGNHWLLTDDYGTNIEFVEDRAVASVHTPTWARDFQFDMIKQYKRVELFTLAEVEAMTVREREDRLKRAWLNKLENTVRHTYEPTYSSNGFWSNAHMLYNQGLSVDAAVEKIGDKNHLRLTSKHLDLTLDGDEVCNQDGILVGRFGDNGFEPTPVVEGMTTKAREWVTNGAYAISGAPNRP